jgi:predicted AAA+ superfamily ATPase
MRCAPTHQLQGRKPLRKNAKIDGGPYWTSIRLQITGERCGCRRKTIRSWISILEASFILFKLPPYSENFGKRVIKSPKYYLTEVGLLCFLFGIRENSQISRDPLVGQICKNIVVIEALRTGYNRGHLADLYYFRDSKGNEVDLLAQCGRELQIIEIKSSTTFKMEHLKGLRRFQTISDTILNSILAYNGVRQELSDGVLALNY